MDEFYPPEYILGEVEFFGKKFFVSPDVLIPRLETEGLVRRARHLLREESIQTLVDIGTGSGIIGISCSDLVAVTTFFDISPKALEVAEKNFHKHFPDKKAAFIISDLLAKYQYQSKPPVTLTSHGGSETNPPIHQSTNILFLANLPYIKHGDWGNMSPDTRHEPELALFGGEDTGFELYERLFSQVQEKGIHGILLIEFGFDQREIAEIVLSRYPWETTFFPDFAGIERFAEIRF